MKKLLFTGLISVGFLIISKESTPLFTDPEHIIALEYFSSKRNRDTLEEIVSAFLPKASGEIDPLKNLLSKISPTMSCFDINVLSEQEFAVFVMQFLSVPPLSIGKRGDLSEEETIAYEQECTFHRKSNEMAVLIHKCRSIVPVYNRVMIEYLKEASDEDFEYMLAEMAREYACFNDDDSQLRGLDRVLADAKDEYLLHPNNVDKLRALRAELRTEK